MQDSDDYFMDDFVLDDTALAILDEEENKYTLSTQNPTPSYVPPPPKRLKTETGWRPGPSSRRAETIDDLDDLPEISVQGDGSYGLHARHAAAVSARPGDIGSGTRMNGAQPQSTSSGRPYSGRVSSDFVSAASSTWPWISTPGMVAETGVVLISLSPTADVPITTSSAISAIDTGTTLIGGPSTDVKNIWAAVPGSSPLTGNNLGFYGFRTP